MEEDGAIVLPVWWEDAEHVEGVAGNELEVDPLPQPLVGEPDAGRLAYGGVPAQAGLGFGGSCFPKDLSAFIKISEQLGYDFKLLKEVQQINSFQMERFVKKITDTLWVLKDKKIGVAPE